MRNVLVTGGSRGLGLAIARKLVGDGFRVLALARKPSDDLSAAIAANPPGALHFVPFDLAQLDGIAELVRGLKTAHGPFYGLVNNAGLGTEGVLTNMPDAKIDALIRLNIQAPVLLTKAVMRTMMVTGEGRIVNMASIIGFTGYSGLSVYGATKASMLGFTRSLAREVGRLGVTVNAVAPGFVDTEMTATLTEEQRARIASRSALKRLAEAEDVAGAVSYLMSEAARNITGTTITVDAGNTA
jgi:3-oxoacyl-[acyl-carrier protein] reductase